MADESAATFNELLSMRVDIPTFAADMDKLVQIYAEKIKAMPGMGTIDSAALQTSINDVKHSLGSMSQAMGESLGAITNQIIESLDGTIAKIDAVSARAKTVSATAAESQAQRDNKAANTGAEEQRQRELASLKSNITQRLGLESDYYASIRQFEKEKETLIEENRAKQLASMKASILGQGKAAFGGSGDPFEQLTQSAQGFFKSFDGGMLGSMAQVAKFYLLWKGVSELFVILGDVIKAPIDAIINGFKYQQDLQERSGELKAVLLQTVQFSGNMAANIRLAGDEAERLTKKIDDTAIKLNTTSQKVQTGLQSFLVYGGRNLVDSLNEAVDVSAKVTAAIQAQNPNTQARQLMSEMQKLVTGDFGGKEDRIAAALGISNTQLKQMVDHAKEYHDLGEQIELHALGLSNRLSEADNRQKDLMLTLELYVKRFEALFVSPLFERVTKWMQDILKYLGDHDAVLQGIGAKWGALLDRVGQFGETFLKANWEGLVVGLKSVLSVVGDLAFGLVAIVNSVSRLAELASNYRNLNDVKNKIPSRFATFGFSDADRAASAKADADAAAADDAYFKKQDEINARHDKAGDDLRKMRGDFQDTLSNPYGTPINKSSSENANTAITGIQGKDADNKLALKKLEDDYTIAFRNIQNAQKELVATTKNDLAEHVISHEAAAKRVVAGYEFERKAVNDLVDTTRIGLAKLKTEKNAVAVEGFGARLTENKNSTGTSSRDAEKAENTAFYKFTEEEEKKHDAAMIKFAEVASQQKLALLKQMSSMGLITQTQALKADEEAERQRHEAVMGALIIEAAAVANDADLFRAAQDKMGAEEQRHTGIVQLNAGLRTQARNAEVRETERAAIASKTIQEQSMVAANNQAVVDGAARTTQLSNLVKIAEKQREIVGLKLAEAEADLRRAQSQSVINPQTINALNEQVASLKVQLAAAQTNASQAVNNRDDPGSLMFRIFGNSDISLAFKSAAEGAKSLTTAFNGAIGAFNSIVGSFKSGGLAGGLGNIAGKAGGFLSSLSEDSTGIGGSIFSALGGASPYVGAALSAVTGVMSIISGMFKSAAVKIGAQIDAQLKVIMTNFQAGSATLSATITALNAERAQAIASLSGKKGGQDQLNKILPGLDQQIASLQKQAHDIIESLDTKWHAMAATLPGDDVLRGWFTTWQSINKEVKTYLDAGGSAAVAQSYLNLSLQQQKIDLQKQLSSGEQSALQDAISLNGLLKQRVDLKKQEAQTEFGILNKYSLEKRQSYSVIAGQDLATAKTAFATQLTALNQQIDLTTQKVALERMVFSISSDIAALHRRDDQLTLDALQQQISGYRQMQQLLGGTLPGVFNPNYIPGITPGNGNVAPVVINITGPIYGGGTGVIDTIRQRLGDLGRFGLAQ